MPEQDPTTSQGAPTAGSADAIRVLQRLLPTDQVVRRRAWDEVLGILKRGGESE